MLPGQRGHRLRGVIDTKRRASEISKDRKGEVDSDVAETLLNIAVQRTRPWEDRETRPRRRASQVCLTTVTKKIGIEFLYFLSPPYKPLSSLFPCLDDANSCLLSRLKGHVLPPPPSLVPLIFPHIPVW